MNLRQRSKSRLATAATVESPDNWIAFQFLRAMLAAPRMPQRILRSLMFWLFDLTLQTEGRGNKASTRNRRPYRRLFDGTIWPMAYAAFYESSFRYVRFSWMVYSSRP